MNPTSSLCLDRTADTKFKITVFHHPFNRFSEAERWMRYTASKRNELPHPETAIVVNSGSVPPVAGAPTNSGAGSPSPVENLFVGSLSYDSTDKTLADHFAKFGEVLGVRVIVDRDSRRSKGFAFVEMRTREDAERAIDGVDGHELDGRCVSVNFARPKEDRPSRRFGSR